jgi:hypothetical protein
MPIPPFVSDIFYSIQNEDANSELAILQHIGRPARHPPPQATGIFYGLIHS